MILRSKMCDTDCNDLIDLGLDEENFCSNTQDKSETQPSRAIPTEPIVLIPSTLQERNSLDNNPFDSVQKLVNRQDDPFDIVEKEVCCKTQEALMLQTEVKEGNLLSLSDDNILDDTTITVEKTEKVKKQDLDKESPPVMMNIKLKPVSESDSDHSSSAETTGSAKSKAAGEYRKKLLKLSISNAAFSSPSIRNNLLEFDDVLGTPVTTMLSKAAEFGENLLSTESPLKLVEDDITVEERSSLVESEKIFEADLEMLRIPILSDLPSPAVDSLSNNLNDNSPDLVGSITPSLDTTLPNLDVIKAKIRAKREKVNNSNQQEVVSLINSLKSLITSGDMVDENKKQHANALLESLSLALKPSNSEENLKIPQEPQTVKRQGTFTLEQQESDQIPLEKPDIPTCMTSSSATYVGETDGDNEYLNLPEIVSLSPPDEPKQNEDCHHNSNESLQCQMESDVSDILEQLGKLLLNTNSTDTGQNIQNPTFIVVMNANPMAQNHNLSQTSIDAKQRSGFVSNYLENSINDGSPDLTKVNPIPRRRAQSLSIHDKIKIVQIQTPTTRCIQKQNNISKDCSQSVSTFSPTSDKETSEFKTPARMLRRNSCSSGTPYTVQAQTRRTTSGPDGKNLTTQLRKVPTLDSHGKGQHQKPVVKQMPMSSRTMPTFKPDLKKKTKNTESIMKCTGPLKALIPVKKVVPMLKASPPTPDTSEISPSFQNTSFQNQLGKTNRVPTTPLTAKEAIRIGYPNACSTPASFSSPLRRPGTSVNKPRYSYMSASPNSKTVLNSNAQTNLRRRTITEFKAKSPLKPRTSTVGLAAAAAASTSTRSLTGNSRLSTLASGRVSKTPVKLSSSNTTSKKAPGQLGSRNSFDGSGISTRNKENKKP